LFYLQLYELIFIVKFCTWSGLHKRIFIESQGFLITKRTMIFYIKSFFYFLCFERGDRVTYILTQYWIFSFVLDILSTSLIERLVIVQKEYKWKRQNDKYTLITKTSGKRCFFVVYYCSLLWFWSMHQRSVMISKFIKLLLK